MKNKLFILLMIVLISVPVACAATNTTLANHTFNIPDGFSLSDEVNETPDDLKPFSITDYLNITENNDEYPYTFSQMYQNDDSKIISIDVVKNPGGTTYDEIREPGDLNKTVSGHNGLLTHDGDFYYFKYIYGDDLIQITTENESYLEIILGE